MNDSGATSSINDSSLELQVAALQRQVFLLLMALIVVAATVVFYLYYQSRILSTDLTAYRPRAVQVIKAYNAHRAEIQNFDKQLNSYAIAHSAFQPVLRKYGWAPSATAPAP